MADPAPRRLAPHPSARWIWAVDADGANAWACFRADIRLAQAVAAAPAVIAADSTYWLWINGVLVVGEGGLKRGPTPVDAYADVVDLGPHLRPGDNHIALLVWYFGHDGASHRSSGRAALLFDLDLGDRHLVSDATWRARRHPAFGQRGEGPTVTLSERGIDFDARADLPDWPTAGGDWPAAIELGAPPAPPWGALIERPIPPWRSDGRRAYSNPIVLPCRGPCEVIGRLPANQQGHPWMRVSGTAGAEVVMQIERCKTSARYVCRDGEQDFESPAWGNGHHVTYRVPEGATLLDLAWRETAYATGERGRFACDEPWLETLWRKAVRTVHLCMRDTWMDCPDRERSQWMGDVANVIELAHVAFDQRATALTAKCFRELAAWRTADGILWSAVPTGRFRGAYREFPAQSLAIIAVGLRDHWLHGGDRGLLAELYPVVRAYLLEVHRCDEAGRVIHRGPWGTAWEPGTQCWYDWDGGQDKALMDQTWYAYALRALALFATALGQADDAERAEGMISGLTKALQEWWDDGIGAYRSPGFSEPPDDRGNALAVCAGLVPVAHRERLAQVLAVREASSIYMERHVIDALFALGRADLALARLRRRYGAALDSASTTLPERFGEESNHGWGAAPAAACIRELAGLAPIVAGWRRFRVAPVEAGPRHIAVTVSSPLGPIGMTLTKGGQWVVELEVPDGAIAELRLPACFTSVTVDGRAVREVPAGRWRILAQAQ